MPDEIKLVPRRATIGEIVYAMEQLPVEIALQIQGRGLRAAAAVVRREARRRAPVSPQGSGSLRDAIRIRPRTDTLTFPGVGGPDVRVRVPGARFHLTAGAGRAGPQAYWAIFQERGTRTRSGQPWIPPTRFVERSVDATIQQQQEAFVAGAARGFISLERRLRTGRATRAQMRAFLSDVRFY